MADDTTSKDPEELNEATLAYIRWQEENPHLWGDQDENGVDLTRLRENLKLSPAERLRKLNASRWMLEFRPYARAENPLR